MKHPVWVGIDLGTQSVRVVAVSDDGNLLAEAATPLTGRREGVRHEQDPEDWWSAVTAGLRSVTARLGAEHSVRALAISATSGTVLLLDRQGQPVTPGIMYDDARGRNFTARVNAVGGAVWSRLGYRMQDSWALPTLLWLRDTGALTEATAIAHQPDLITARLAGRTLASDSSHALKSGLDLDSLRWPIDVLTELGIPPQSLPEIRASGQQLGTVGPEGAAVTGLPEGCAIIAGMTDGCAGQLASGALTPGSWNSVLGTTLVVKGVSRQRRPDPTGAVYAHAAPFGIGWFPGGASSTGAGAIAHWLPNRDLEALTAQAAASTEVPVAYPLVGFGERFPFVSAAATGFFGPDQEDDARRFSAICHGVAYVERLAYDLLDFCGYDTGGTISFSGGGARNDWWNQLRCDLLGRRVSVPQHSEGALGMAVLAAAAMDRQSPAAERLSRTASRLLPPAAELRPDAARGHRLSSGYAEFLEILLQVGSLPAELYSHARSGVR